MVAAFILAAILFICPVSHGKWEYHLLDISKNSQKYLLFIYPLMGLVAGCFREKIWRIIICAALSIYALVPCFYVKGDIHVAPYWGAIFLVGGIAAFISLAAKEQSKLEEIPSPLRNIDAQKKWIYILLAVVGSLFFYVCNLTSTYDGWTGSRWMNSALWSHGSDGWFMIIQPIIAAAAVVCGLKGIKALNITMSILMFITPIIFAADCNHKMGMGFYLYLLCSAGMLVTACLQKSGVENNSSENKFPENKEQQQEVVN